MMRRKPISGCGLALRPVQETWYCDKCHKQGVASSLLDKWRVFSSRLHGKLDQTIRHGGSAYPRCSNPLVNPATPTDTVELGTGELDVWRHLARRIWVLYDRKGWPSYQLSWLPYKKKEVLHTLATNHTNNNNILL